MAVDVLAEVSLSKTGSRPPGVVAARCWGLLLAAGGVQKPPTMGWELLELLPLLLPSELESEGRRPATPPHSSPVVPTAQWEVISLARLVK